MACHGACGDFLLVLAEEQALPPVQEIAAVGSAEQVQHHRHGPEPECGRKYQVFRPADNLARYRVELRLRAETVGIVHKQEVDGAHPVKHTAEQTQQRLFDVAFYEYTDNDHQQTEQPHSHTGIELFHPAVPSFSARARMCVSGMATNVTAMETNALSQCLFLSFVAAISGFLYWETAFFFFAPIYHR